MVQKSLGCGKSCYKREVYSDTSLPQEARNIANNLILHLKDLEKEEKTKPQTSRRKEIMKIRAEINDIEPKNKTKQKQNNNKKNPCNKTDQ